MLRKNMILILLKKVAYAIIDFKNYHATILATGSEVEIAYNASKKLHRRRKYKCKSCIFA